MQDKMEIEKIGYCSGLESTLLLIKFETMLNSIYSLCENLAFVGHILHPGIPESFNEQRIKSRNIGKNIPNIQNILIYLKISRGMNCRIQ